MIDPLPGQQTSLARQNNMANAKSRQGDRDIN
jgi:hypothetical protein